MKQAGIEWCEAFDRNAYLIKASCGFEAKWRAISPSSYKNFNICDKHKVYYQELDSKQPIPAYTFEPIEDTVTPPSDQ